jgi:hypothetical protein
MDHALEAVTAERGEVLKLCSRLAAGGTSVRWVTQRGDWQGLGVDADGDARTVAVLQRLKVV